MREQNTERRFLDSSLDQTDLITNRSTGEFVGVETIRPDLGERQFPGQGGFRLADTPQAWIFIQKKEWLDDTWTYVVETPIVTVDGQAVDIGQLTDQIEAKEAALNRSRQVNKRSEAPTAAEDISSRSASEEAALQKEIKEKKEILAKARVEAAKTGGQSQFDGKVTQINIRTALGNIITRKLDWMNDHEKFAKISPITQTQFEGIRIQKAREKLPDNLRRVKEERNRIDNNIKLIQDQNAELARSIATLEILRNKTNEQLAGPTTSPEELAQITAALEQIEQQIIVANNRLSRNEARKSELVQRLSEVDVLAQLPTGEQDPIVDADTSLLYAPVTLSGNAFTRYFKSPIFRNVDTPEAKALSEKLKSTLEQLEKDTKTLVDQTRVAGNSVELIQRQQQYIETKRAFDKINVRLQLQRKNQKIKLETGASAFNGVIELANVTSVSTTVSLEGEGSATFTIENPQNIFFISRDDIDVALKSDPFLEKPKPGLNGSDGTESLVFYRGRYLPQHTVNMLRARKGSAIEVGRLSGISSEDRAENLRSILIPGLEREIENKRRQSSSLYFGGQFAKAATVEQEVAGLTADLLVLKSELDSLEKDSLQQEVEKQAERDRERKADETFEKGKEMNLIRQTLLKYYAGKAIFQVLDRVYIWMTSPTRTLYRLNRTGTDRFAIEDPSVIAISQQLAAARQKFEALEEEIIRVKNFINDQVAKIGQLSVIKISRAKLLEDAMALSARASENEDFEAAAARIPSDPNILFEVGAEFRQFAGGRLLLTGANIGQYFIDLINEQKLRLGVLQFLEKQVKSTDSLTQSNTFSKIPTAPEEGLLTKEQADVIGQYDSRFIGLEEDRLQVFQGVISTVKQIYSNGKYQITVSCKDNMVFLNMSRIMVKPALRNSGQSPQGILQDPIWRNNQLAGNWKNGILVLDFAFVNDEIGAKLDKNIAIRIDPATGNRNTKVTSESEARRAVSPFVTSLPFARIDAANLVSFIITGFPYNFEQFIQNAAFGGRLTLNQKSGVSDQLSEDSSFFAALKRQIGEVNDRLGDFEPFIDLEAIAKNLTSLSKREKALKDAVDVASNDLEKKYEAYLINRLERYLSRVGTKAHDSILNSYKINAVEPSLSIKGEYGKKFSDFEQLAQEVARRLRAQKGDAFGIAKQEEGEESSLTLLQLFSRTIVNAAKKNTVNNESTERTTKIGTVVGTDAEISRIKGALKNNQLKFQEEAGTLNFGGDITSQAQRDIVARRIQSPALGVFVPIVELLILTAETVATRGSGVAQAAGTKIGKAGPAAVDKALTAFIKELLTIQSEFAQEYQAASLAFTNLAGFRAIQGTLDKFLNDIRNEAASVSQDIKEGPNATIEKIVRREKKNFLIISDRYTLDESIQAYHTEVGGGNFALFQSEFETALSVCRRAADQVDFEFFADEDGNLQFKPPTYNRILREHFDLISETDAVVRDAVLIRYGGEDGNVFRAVLKGISKLNELKNEFSSKRLLARRDLEKSLAEIKKGEKVTRKQVDNEVSTAEDLTERQIFEVEQNIASSRLGGSLIEEHIKSLKGSGAADLQDEVNEQNALANLLQSPGNNSLNTISGIGVSIDAERQAEESVRLLRRQEDRFLIQIEILNKLRQDALNPLQAAIARERSALKAAKAAKPPVPKDVMAKEAQVAKTQRTLNTFSARIRADKATQKAILYTRLIDRIDDLLAEAQKVGERARKNTEEFVNALPTFTDESRIHRIADHDLISYDMTEAPPRFTHLEIQGSPEIVKVTPAEYYWAGGVDYDNCRQYGFMSESMQKAYFHSGSVARTYLRAMLGRERGRVLSASAQVRGDSKYRVGDCVFIEHLGMYFYITSTSHQLTYGQSYTTNLVLAYGRRIGELIPHPFDALGKIMIEAYQSDIELLLAREQFLALEKEKQLRSKFEG
jgi:hypothetical protein